MVTVVAAIFSNMDTIPMAGIQVLSPAFSLLSHRGSRHKLTAIASLGSPTTFLTCAAPHIMLKVQLAKFVLTQCSLRRSEKRNSGLCYSCIEPKHLYPCIRKELSRLNCLLTSELKIRLHRGVDSL